MSKREEGIYLFASGEAVPVWIERVLVDGEPVDLSCVFEREAYALLWDDGSVTVWPADGTPDPLMVFRLPDWYPRDSVVEIQGAPTTFVFAWKDEGPR